MIGMPYFDEPTGLGKFATQEEALAAVEAGLAAGSAGRGRCTGWTSPATRRRSSASRSPRAAEATRAS